MLLSDLLGRRWRCRDEYGSYERPIVEIEDVADVRISSSDRYRYVLRVHVGGKVCHDFFHGHQASEDRMVRCKRLEAVSLEIFETPEMTIYKTLSPQLDHPLASIKSSIRNCDCKAKKTNGARCE